MKRALLFFTLAVVTHAAEPPTDYVLVKFQIVQMPQTQALKLVPRLLDAQAAPAAYAEIQQGIVREEVKLVDQLSAELRSGDRVQAEHRDERRFPSEYQQDDPRVGSGMALAGAGKERVATSYPVTNFENANCGASLEIEARTVADGKWIVANLSATMKELTGWDRYESGKRADGRLLYYEQPIFRTHKTATNLSFPAGAPQIVGIYQLNGESPITEVHLLTAKVRSVMNALVRPAHLVDSGYHPPEPARSAEPPKMLTIEAHRFHVGQAEALALRGALLDPQRIEGALGKLLESAVQGRAKLVDWNILSTLSGNRVVAENVVERRYGRDHEIMGSVPQALPANFSFPVFRASLAPATSFETKNTGQSFEVEPTQAWSGGAIDLNSAFWISDLPEFRRWTMAPDPDRQQSYFFQPTFYTRHSSTTLVVAAGQRKLYGFNQLPKSLLGNGGQYEIVLLRVMRRQ